MIYQNYEIHKHYQSSKNRIPKRYDKNNDDPDSTTSVLYLLLTYIDFHFAEMDHFHFHFEKPTSLTLPSTKIKEDQVVIR